MCKKRMCVVHLRKHLIYEDAQMEVAIALSLAEVPSEYYNIVLGGYSTRRAL